MNTNKIDTPTLILIVILMMGLINGLMSCTTSRLTSKMVFIPKSTYDTTNVIRHNSNNTFTYN